MGKQSKKAKRRSAVIEHLRQTMPDIVLRRRVGIETGGLIVMSYRSKPSARGTNERKTFDHATLETLTGMLADIAPENDACQALRTRLQEPDTFA